jgi:DNA sulfur modification protein DndE
MLPQRIRLSEQATKQLEQLKTRTGISSNILARLALSHSIGEKNDKSKVISEPKKLDLKGIELEISQLLGEYSEFYERLLAQLHGVETTYEFSLILAIHIENGLNAIKNVQDLSELLSQINSSNKPVAENPS